MLALIDKLFVPSQTVDNGPNTVHLLSVVRDEKGNSQDKEFLVVIKNC